jgi:phosphoribosyl-AMP cyclohydrolase / phosphoribosyl-ATP pyrophosphohydrolase
MIEKLNFAKLNGLIPAIIQDTTTNQVLMVGFMNRDAVERTIRERTVVFWSRTKGRLWQKGESSGNTLAVSSMQIDCDGDALLIRAVPAGPVCHTGTFTCFGEERSAGSGSVLEGLEEIIRERREQKSSGSYTAKLFAEGTSRIAQKVGEEAVETVVAAMGRDRSALQQEAADLLYHLLVLLHDQEVALGDVMDVLKKRMVKPAGGNSGTETPAG